MDARRYIFILTATLSIFMFFTGAVMLVYSKHMPDSGGQSSDSPLDDIIAPLKPVKESVNILVMGGDKVGANTDTMMLVNFNPSTFNITVLSIPRDTKVNVKGSSIPKINSAYPIGGEKLAIETVSRLLNVNIKHYVYIDTTAFRKIINTLDGVDVYVPVDMDYDDPLQDLHIHLKKGWQHLNGEQAEQFMRFRQPNSYNNEIMQYYDGSDLKRIDAQQSLIRELIRQKANLKYLTRIDSIIEIVFNSIKTDISLEDALKLSANIGRLNADEVKMFKLPGYDSEEETGWYYIINKSEAEKIIKQYFDSRSPSAGKPSKSPDAAGKAAKPAPSQKPRNTPSPPTPGGNIGEAEEKKPDSRNEGISVDMEENTIKSFSTDNPSNSETSMGNTNESMP